MQSLRGKLLFGIYMGTDVWRIFKYQLTAAINKCQAMPLMRYDSVSVNNFRLQSGEFF
jgi:hypothetical protein